VAQILVLISGANSSIDQWRRPTGAQPALHFGGGSFHEVSFDDVIVHLSSGVALIV